jgi:hypothetical protein
MPQILVIALFGLVALAVAFQAVLSGRTAIRGMHCSRQDEPATFWLVVIIYVALGLLSLAGAVWTSILWAREARA